MINLSCHNINHIEKSVLGLGLKFVPYQKPSLSSVLEGFDNFSRNVKLSYFFNNKNPKHSSDHSRLYKEKSSWTPNDKLLPPDILEELDTLKLKLSKMRIIPEDPNLHPAQYLALEELSKKDDLVFKKSDKGNAIVIMDKQNYIDEAMSQLNKSKYYEPISEPIYTSTFEEVTSILAELKNKGLINQSQLNYLKPNDSARDRMFYTLPKVHKDQSKWREKYSIPPGRPIVSDVESDSYHYASLIDNALKPISNLHPSYIKNTYDFLDELRDQVFDEDVWLVTIDIESLYTNIQPDQGIRAVQSVYDRSDIHIHCFSEIKRLLEISLKNNDFKFGDHWFRQKWGVSMGKIFAPTLANIFLAEWEKDLFALGEKIRFYKRFLDDGFLIFKGSMEELLEFLNCVNNHDESINITWDISAFSVNFCDVSVFKGNRFFHHRILDTKLYVKPTDQ